MPKTTTNPFTQTIRHAVTNLATGDGAISGGLSSTNIFNTKAFLSAGSEGSVVKSITITSDDSAAKNIAFYLNTDGGTSRYLLGVINVPITSGYTGAIINVDVLNNRFNRVNSRSNRQTGITFSSWCKYISRSFNYYYSVKRYTYYWYC